MESPNKQNKSGGSSTSEGAGGSEETDGTSSQQRRGGHFRFGFGTPPRTLSPFRTTAGMEYVCTQQLYSNLVNYDADLELVGDLATDWSANDDLTKWRFKLRDDATWHHNGNRVLAEDVKATYDAIQNPDNASPVQGSLGGLESVEVVNDHEVQMNMEGPYGPFPNKTALVHCRIMPKDVLADGIKQFSTQEFGSGPFVLDEFQPSDHVSMSRYDDYYGEYEGVQEPLLDRWSGLVRPEASSRVTAFQNKSVDALYEVPVSQFKRVSNSQGVEMHTQPGGNLFEIVLHTGIEPFDDVRVRQAIKYALNLEVMLSSAQQGHGHVAQHNPISPAHKYYADLDNVFGPGAKVDKGKELLAEAGYGDGIDLDFPLEVVTDQADANQLSIIGTLAQQQLKEIGFRFEIKNITTSQYYDVFMTDEAKFITSWWDFRPLEESIYRLCLHSEGNWNQTHWKNREFDRALEKSERSTDPAVKKRQLEKCQKLAYLKGGFICPFFKDRIGASRPYVRNTGPLFEATTQRSPSENVWLADDAPKK